PLARRHQSRPRHDDVRVRIELEVADFEELLAVCIQQVFCRCPPTATAPASAGCRTSTWPCSFLLQAPSATPPSASGPGVDTDQLTRIMAGRAGQSAPAC